MKRLLFIIVWALMGVSVFAQTYDTLPTGSKPYGNQLYITPTGLIIGGTGSAKFRVLGTKKYVDSLVQANSLTFNNGLAKNLNNVSLGGIYSGNIVIGEDASGDYLVPTIALYPSTPGFPRRGGLNFASEWSGGKGVNVDLFNSGAWRIGGWKTPSGDTKLLSGEIGFDDVTSQLVINNDYGNAKSSLSKGIRLKRDYSTGWGVADSLFLAPKAYVDRAVGAIDLSEYVTKTGTQTLTNKTLTAPVINTPDITNGTANSMTLVNGTINNTTIGTTGASTVRGTTITATVDVLLPSATPSNALSAAPVAYVQNAINGLSWKQQVDFATTGNVTLSGSQTVDGVSSGNAKRALVKNQTNPAQNGVYITSSSGSWTRTADANTADNLSKLTVLVGGGLSQQYTVWTSAGSVTTVGTDPVNLVQSAGPGSYLAGSNMTLSGNVFSTVNAPVFDTQPVSDNSNKAATTYYVGSKLATGQTIGANTTGSADKWNGLYNDFNTSLESGLTGIIGTNGTSTIHSFTPASVTVGNSVLWNGQEYQGIAPTNINAILARDASNGKYAPISQTQAKAALNINDGSVLNNDATKWGGREFDAVEATSVDRLMGYDGATSKWKYAQMSVVKTALNLNDGSNLNNNAKLWGNYEFDTSDLGTGVTWMMGLDATTGKVMPFSKPTIKTALATSLQDVTSVGNTTTTGANFGGILSWGSGSGSSNIGQIFNNAALGTTILPKIGTTSDLTLANGAGTAVISIPTGTTNAKINGKLTWGYGAYTSGESQIFNDNSDGTILVAKTGSTNDFILANGSGATVMNVPTGTLNPVFPGNVKIGLGAPPVEKLDVSGNVIASGFFKGNSIIATSGGASNVTLNNSGQGVFQSTATKTITIDPDSQRIQAVNGQIMNLNFETPTATRNVLIRDRSGSLAFTDEISTTASGTYTPTLSNTFNVTSTTPLVAHYMRVGNEVTVTGRFAATSTSAGTMQVGISLPISSSMTATEDATGMGSSTTTSTFRRVDLYYKTADSTVVLETVTNDTGSNNYRFQFTYTIK
ncbi:hypothetical protein DBR40_05230 [Pedobacter sp. KBW01]|uniref:beta strand repeat-containing protein n=1 Tax=Pedobacter sp. KBW01 TaxID=2153364 RepID=UPI000F59B298|nr:hypothetical protein [Pedobacter sp. KBW01]RQO79123.1 hypothetical protein DBR40_05230 [Pedobacter sp. KBW01]